MMEPTVSGQRRPRHVWANLLGAIAAMFFLRYPMARALAPVMPSSGWAEVASFVLLPFIGWWVGGELALLTGYLRRGRGAAAAAVAPAVAPADPPLEAPEPRPAPAPVASTPPRDVGVGWKIFGGTIATVVGLYTLAAMLAPLAFAGFGVYLIRDWAVAGRQDLLRTGVRATTDGRLCRFEGLDRPSAPVRVQTSYMLQVGSKPYACPAGDGVTPGNVIDPDGACPCLDRRVAYRERIARTKCDEHVDVLYNPADPTDCRPVAAIGRRTDRESNDLPFGLLTVALGLFVFFRIAGSFWRRPAKKRKLGSG